MQRRSLLGGILLAGVMACPAKENAVWVVEGSSTEEATFALSDKRGGTKPLRVWRIDVLPCDSLPRYLTAPHTGATWSMVRIEAFRGDPNISRPSNEGPDSLNQVVYGKAPLGYHAANSAPDLKPGGCYVVDVAGEPGAARTMFRVSPDGGLTELTRDERAAEVQRQSEASQPS